MQLFSLLVIATVVHADCTHDNTLRDLIRKADIALPFCSQWNARITTSTTTVTSTASNCVSTAPTAASASITPVAIPTQLAVSTAKLSSACSCLLSTASPSTSTVTASATTFTPAPECSGLSSITLRIEGRTATTFEGKVYTGPTNLTTASGGTHKCDGTNLNANPQPGATCSSALQSAAQKEGFPFDGTWSATFDDFFITSIGPDTQTSTEFWGLLVDWQFTAAGGCQTEVTPGHEVLWAFDAFNKQNFLKLVGPASAFVGQEFEVMITDGSSGVPISGAVVDGGMAPSDATGKVVVKVDTPGTVRLKAEAQSSIRSNAVVVNVS